jgi:hypothetical protein
MPIDWGKTGRKIQNQKGSEGVGPLGSGRVFDTPSDLSVGNHAHKNAGGSGNVEESLLGKARINKEIASSAG